MENKHNIHGWMKNNFDKNQLKDEVNKYFIMAKEYVEEQIVGGYGNTG